MKKRPPSPPARPAKRPGRAPDKPGQPGRKASAQGKQTAVKSARRTGPSPTRSGRKSTGPTGPGSQRKRSAATRISTAENQRLSQVLRISEVELETQNRELRETHGLLEQSRDRYADLYDFAPVGFLSLTPAGLILDLNLTCATMLGRERARLTQMPFSLFVEKSSLTAFRRHLRELKPLGGLSVIELSLVTTGGRTMEVEIRSLAVPGQEGQTSEIRSSLMDISARKAAERGAQASASLNQSILDSLMAHIAVLDGEGVITAVNAAWTRFGEANGNSHHQSVGRSYFEVCGTSSTTCLEAAEAKAGIEAVLAGSRLEFHQTYACDSPTQRRWFQMSVSPLVGTGGGVVVSHVDITARVMAEEALRVSQERLSLAIEASNNCVWDWNIQTGEVYYTPRWLESQGYSVGDTPPTIDFWKSCLHPDDWERAESALQAHFEGDTPVYQCENRLRTKAGEYRWHADLGRVVSRDAQGRPLRMVGTDVDITDRKQAELKLRESERHERERAAELSALLQALPTPVLIAQDPACQRIIGNPAADALLRLARGAEASQSAPTGLRPEHFRILKDGRELGPDELPTQRAARGEKVRDFEYRLQFDDGSSREVLVYATPLWDEANQPRGAISVLVDITERKQMELNLRASESRERERAAELAAILEAVPTAVFIAHDPECLHISGNRAADELLRHSRGAEASLSAPAGLKPVHFRALQNGRELTVQELPSQRAAHGENIRDFECSLVFDDGSVREMLSYATPLLSDSRQTRGSIHVLLDITERKQAERRLAASEAQLHSFVHQAPAAMAMFDREMNYLATSHRWAQDYGDGREELAGLNCYEFLPDIPERWKAVAERGQRGETITCEEDQWLRGDGSQLWLRWSVSPWRNNTGQIGGIMILAENVTLAKQAEAAIRESGERLRLSLEASRIGTFEIDLTSHQVRWNSVEYELLGLPPDSQPASVELFLQFVSPKDRDRVHREWDEASNTGHFDSEFRIVRADGVERWLAGRGAFTFLNTVPIGATPAQPSRFLGVNFDITGRKRAEQAVVRSEFLLSRSQSIAHVGSYEFPLPPAGEAHCSAELSRIIGRPDLGATITTSDYLNQVVHPDDRELVRSALQEVARPGERYETTYRVVRPDGSIRFVHSVGELFEAADGEGPRLVGSLQDITELRNLEAEMVEVVEREQSRFGQDLHDGLCQQLAGIEFRLLSLRQKIAGTAPEAIEEIKKTAALIRQAIEQSRTLARGLSPVALEEDGLAAALKELAAGTAESFGLVCTFDCPLPITVPDNSVATHLYRIAQEAIHNAVRHGQARSIQIRLTKHRHRLVLSIKDDGIGFPEPLPRNQGMGLRVMRHRAATISGTLVLKNQPKGGASILCSLPEPEPRC